MAYSFPGQLIGENVIIISKQHPFVLIRSVLAIVAVLLIPFLLLVILDFTSLIGYVMIICLLVAIFLSAKTYLRWNNTVLMVTNKRVLISTQKSFVSHSVQGSDLKHVHRVTHEITGLFPSLFNFGTLSVMTDDQQSALVMPGMPDPYEMQQEILRLTNEDLINNN